MDGTEFVLRGKEIKENEWKWKGRGSIRLPVNCEEKPCVRKGWKGKSYLLSLVGYGYCSL